LSNVKLHEISESALRKCASALRMVENAEKVVNHT